MFHTISKLNLQYNNLRKYIKNLFKNNQRIIRFHYMIIIQHFNQKKVSMKIIKRININSKKNKKKKILELDVNKMILMFNRYRVTRIISCHLKQRYLKRINPLKIQINSLHPTTTPLMFSKVIAQPWIS